MTTATPSNSSDNAESDASLPANGLKIRHTPAAERALAEAQARRAEINRRAKEQPKELNGRNGPDPARYGDWEVKGIASDF
jgi:hypothetical protein